MVIAHTDTLFPPLDRSILTSLLLLKVTDVGLGFDLTGLYLALVRPTGRQLPSFMARLTRGHNLNAFDGGVSADGFMRLGVGVVDFILKIGLVLFAEMVDEFDS